MKEISLLCSLDNRAVEAALIRVVTHFEAKFPEKVKGYYLFGSHRSGLAVSNSDLDVAAVFRSDFRDEDEREEVNRSIQECAAVSPIELDLTTPIETTLLENGNATLKLDSILVYGEDIRANLELPDIQSWIRDRMHDGFGYIRSLRSNVPSALPKDVAYPLDFPNPASEFYGYAERGTKDLATTIGWCASAILAYRLRTHVFRKSDCLELYRTQVADGWTALVESVFERVRSSWNYQIPKTLHDRQHLRDICQQALRFENHFLLLYRDFLLDDLSSRNGEHRQLAASRLRQIFSADPIVRDRLAAVSAGDQAR